MNEKGFAHVILVVLVLAAVVGFSVKTYLDNRNEHQSTAANQETGTSADGQQNSFNPASTENLAFEAELTTTDSSGNVKSQGTLRYDGNGTAYFQASEGGQTIESITTPDAVYLKSGSTWTKYPSNAQDSTQTDDYHYSQSDISDFQAVADYQGTQSCPAGTCHVWGGDGTFIYVDTKTNYISKTETRIEYGDGQTDTATAIYTFKKVNIELPTNVKELSIPTP